MCWEPKVERRDLIEDLPAPRDDEPSNLRQDIADELLDHLQSALNRELHRTPDEQAAKQSVLERFGNPRQIARRLWLDAIQERIMSQRIMLAMSVLTAIVCLVALGVVWRIAEDSRAANLAMIEEAKTANQALLSKLGEMAGDGAVAESREWTEFQVRVVLGETGGEPVADCRVNFFSSTLSSDFNTFNTDMTTDAGGIADIGLIRFGAYHVSVTTPWGEGTQTSVYVRPQVNEIEVVCPPPLGTGKLAFDVNWPEDLRGRDLYLLASFHPEVRTFAGNLWRQTDPTVAVFTNGDVGRVSMRQIGPGRGQAALGVDEASLAIFLETLQGPYWLENIEVIYMQHLPGTGEKKIFYEVLASAQPGVAWPPVEFEVVPNRENVCTVDIPDWAVEKVREALAKQSEG